MSNRWPTLVVLSLLTLTSLVQAFVNHDFRKRLRVQELETEISKLKVRILAREIQQMKRPIYIAPPKESST